MDDTTIRVINDDTVVIANDNTTIGYATFEKASGTLSYIFVNPAFRRRGYGARLLAASEKEAKKPLKPAEPISPLGRKFFSIIAKV
ncbi:MAG: N-acetyltransferase [Rhodospirillaceae bacterium]|nr:MAG: N-acetyltransferase [Rhodospirillaceae bacterium TMED63]RZO38735.1 MAG: N-acetyltransferase [Rhodospirillaceae bacterium]|tara:strand:- start:8 stop:265 length:258 start_codon:yes stop_codon:yes gene_type:complete